MWRKFKRFLKALVPNTISGSVHCNKVGDVKERGGKVHAGWKFK
jgi:hypothetical protein